MSENSQNLIKLLHKLVSSNVEEATALMEKGPISNRDLIYDFSADDVALIRSISLSNAQKRALEKLLLFVSRNTIFGVLCIFDGISVRDDMEVPNILLVDQETREYIADDSLLNEAFIAYLDSENEETAG